MEVEVSSFNLYNTSFRFAKDRSRETSKVSKGTLLFVSAPHIFESLSCLHRYIFLVQHRYHNTGNAGITQEKFQQWQTSVMLLSKSTWCHVCVGAVLVHSCCLLYD